MIKKAAAFSFFFLCCFHFTYAQTTLYGTVKGKGEAITGVTVRISHSRSGASTDSSGNYKLTTTLRGPRRLIFSAIGYKTDSTTVNIKGDSLRVDYKLNSADNSLNTVSVGSTRTRSQEKIDIKRGMSLNAFEVATTAGAIADVTAALRTLPGAAPQSNETGFYVRGGDGRETDAYFDGMLLKNPFGSRLPDISNRSRFSAFMLKETTFSSGGYSAQYGQALSSLLIFETKDLPDKSSNEFALLTLGAGAAHTERMKNSSYLIGANYYNFGLNNAIVPQSIDWQKDPESKQFTFQYKLKPTRSGMFKIFADYSDTRLSLNFFNPGSGANTVNNNTLVSNTNKNIYLNSSYDGYLNDNLKIQTGISYNKTGESGELNYLPYHQDDDVLHGRVTLTQYLFKKSDIIAGADVFSNTRDEGYGSLGRRYHDMLYAAYAETNLFLTNKLMMRAGGRVEYSQYIDALNLSPRLTFTYKTGLHSQVLASYGIFYQKPDDSYLTQTTNLTQEKASHYIVNFEHSDDKRTFRIEGYYKDYAALTKLVTPTYSGLQAYGPVLITGFSNGGSGHAKGVDVFWRDKKTIPLGEYYVAYSYVDSKRNYLDYATAAQPAFAPRHTFNMVVRKFYIKSKTQLSATYTFSSGRTYYNPLNPVFLGDKTQAYHNLSTTISYLPRLFKQFSVINFTIANIPGFKQVFGYRYTTDGLNRQPILPVAKRNYMLGLLINFGDNTFNH